MIGPNGPAPNLLRQYELGQVPTEIAKEEDATRRSDLGHEERAKGSAKRGRWRWLRFRRRR